MRMARHDLIGSLPRYLYFPSSPPPPKFLVVPPSCRLELKRSFCDGVRSSRREFQRSKQTRSNRGRFVSKTKQGYNNKERKVTELLDVYCFPQLPSNYSFATFPTRTKPVAARFPPLLSTSPSLLLLLLLLPPSHSKTPILLHPDASKRPRSSLVARRLDLDRTTGSRERLNRSSRRDSKLGGTASNGT